MASGFGGQHFTFVGYLPQNQGMLAKRLRQLEKLSRSHSVTQIFIETPYRNIKTFEAMLRTLHEQTSLCVACRLTGDDEYIATKTIGDWKAAGAPDLHKKETVFLLSAQ